ncbi:MAG: tetratricopeptide repeat protein [Isosphaerales bacterium]
MGAKRQSAKVGSANPGPEPSGIVPAAGPDLKPGQRRGHLNSSRIVALLVLVSTAAGSYLGYDQYRVHRLAGMVRKSFASRRYEAAREPLRHWLAVRPRAGEAYYYKAWEALAFNQPREAELAVEQAGKLGFDPERLGCLSAIYRARADRFDEAEPVLTQAFLEQVEPQEMVAKELARIFLSTYRLDRAIRPIERWRVLAPEDPQPYLWNNEIASRSDVEPAILIQNYRAALERDPKLDKARLGLAQELSKARRFDDAEQEFLVYLKRNPKDSSALLGLGRNAFQQGNIEKSRQYFETSREANPREPETLKELGQIDLRLGRSQQARERLELLIQIQPFDHEVRYSYAQALKLSGDEARARVELARAARLRKEHDQLVQLRFRLIKHPRDLDTRFQVAKWMMEHGHEQEGLKWTKEILRADPRHPPTHGLLAAYYDQRGDPGLANYHRLWESTGQDGGSGPRIGARQQAP